MKEGNAEASPQCLTSDWLSLCPGPIGAGNCTDTPLGGEGGENSRYTTVMPRYFARQLEDEDFRKLLSQSPRRKRLHSSRLVAQH